MGPLVRRAPLRLARSGLWGLLVAASFVLLSAAPATAPLLAEAAGNAALTDQLSAVPPDAPAGSAPVVRLVGGAGVVGQGRLDGALDRVPGLRPSLLTATSVGVEQRQGRPGEFTLFVAAGGRVERARLFGDDDPPSALVPAEGEAAAPSAAGSSSDSGGPGVWLPAPVAERLDVGAGDRVQVGLTDLGTDVRADAEVAGVYAVDAGGRLPADPADTRRWSQRRPFLPLDSEFRTLPAFLLVTDVATASQLAATIGDDLLFALEGQLAPDPTLAQARATVAGIRALQVTVRDPALLGETPDRLRPQVVSGVPALVRAAGGVATRTVAWTSTLTAAGTGLGFIGVLAVAVLSMVRRTIEVRHGVGVGLRPRTIGALASVEVAPVAILGAAIGLGVAVAVVRLVGPPGVITAPSIVSAGWRAGLAGLAGTIVVGAAGAVFAWSASRLRAAAASPPAGTWELVLTASAVTAAAGVYARPVGTGPPSVLELIVPVLAISAAGALGARLALRLANLPRRRAPLEAARPALRLAAQPALRLAAQPALRLAARPALRLAGRRLAAGGTQTVLVVTVVSAGLGLLTYSVAAATSVLQVTQDRAAVLAGAPATAEVEVSWLLDDGAAQLPSLPDPADPADATEPAVLAVPADPAGAPELDDGGPVPGARTPPLPAGTTIVWRGRTSVPPELTNLDLLVIDTASFADVASWGTGPELARAKALLPELARRDRAVTAALVAREPGSPVPAIGVGDVPERRGDLAALTTLGDDVPIEFLDVVPAFPGLGNALPLVVVPADAFFAWLGTADPRVQPPAGTGKFDRTPTEYFPSLWSNRGPAALRAIVEPRGIELGRTQTLAEAGQQPDLVAARRSLGLQVALGVAVGSVAILALAMFADRAATRSRAADLLLARIGMGRAGPRRARAIELAVLAALGLVLGTAGVLALIPLGPRLLDPGGGPAPAFVLRLGAWAPTAAACAALLALAVAVVVARVRSPRPADPGVLRDGA